jgi:poly(3-hydroxybutyrate) depolymerase
MTGPEKLRERTSRAGGVTYFLYEPEKAKAGRAKTPLFVTVHGWSRNAREHAELLLPFAAKRRVAMVAPLFDRARFPWYQRLGTSEEKGRADLALDEIVAAVAKSGRADGSRIYLFGYSGGAQFAHRYAMAHPDRVARAALGAPGWYTFPDPQQAYPRGTGPSRKFPGFVFEAGRFLGVPVKVLVGELDTKRDRNLNKTPAIDRHQGLDRLERGRRWVQAVTAAGRACGAKTEIVFQVLPGADHSFRRCMEAGGMGERVFEFLFPPRPRPRS